MRLLGRLRLPLLSASTVCLSMPAALAQTPPLGARSEWRWSADRLRSAEEFAVRIEKILLGEDPDALTAMFDLDGIASAITVAITDDERETKSTRREMRKGLEGALRQVVEMWRQSMPKKKRVLIVDGRVAARFRFTGDGVVMFFDLWLEPAGAEWRIVDFSHRVMGFGMVEQLRVLFASLFADEDPGVFARLFGSNDAANDRREIDNMNEARKRGDHTGVLAAFQSLSAPVQKHGLIRRLWLQSLAMVGTPDEYVAALEETIRMCPAPLRFSYVDAFVVKKDWQKAIACVDELIASLERDAALLALRASFQQQAGDVPGARKTLAEALRLEPDCEYALLNGLDVLLAAKDWPALRSALQALEKTGNHDVRAMLEDEAWTEFRKAPESEPWR
jgi:tetratricopeptide (TPR) repeat protein